MELTFRGARQPDCGGRTNLPVPTARSTRQGDHGATATCQRGREDTHLAPRREEWRCLVGGRVSQTAGAGPTCPYRRPDPGGRVTTAQRPGASEQVSALGEGQLPFKRLAAAIIALSMGGFAIG